jgi:hypothetical protein
MHKTIEPSILYFGTAVALISTMNLDGTRELGSNVIGVVAGLELHAWPWTNGPDLR